MAKNDKEYKVKRLRISLIDDDTHKQLWIMKFTRGGLILTLLSTIASILAISFVLFAFTPLKLIIPGYPDAHVRRTEIQTALRLDSLEKVIMKWEFYAENLRHTLSGEAPVHIDSIIKRYTSHTDTIKNRKNLHSRDSVLRKEAEREEQTSLTEKKREMPIEGVHFFVPLKGVISEKYDPAGHPYIDITAPANSVVMAVLDGTIIGAEWSDDNGYTIQIQHSNNLISVYKYNQTLLKYRGEKVAAGTPIALTGNFGSKGKGERLHFELWYKGAAIDPEKYINF